MGAEDWATCNVSTNDEHEAVRERLRRDMESFVSMGGLVKLCAAGESADLPQKQSPLVSGQKRAAMLHRAAKGRMTNKQRDVLKYINTVGKCTLQQLKHVMKSNLSTARKTAQALANKLAIEFDGETISTRKRAAE